MSIKNLSNISGSDLSISTPVCIIGAGLAGLLMACRLARAGQMVVVLESGDGSGSLAANELNEIDDPAGRYTRAMSGRHRGLGGTSSRWGGRMIPVSHHDATARPHVALPAWPFPMNELARYESEIESLFGLARGSHEEIPFRNGAPSPFPVDEPSLTPRWAKVPSFKKCNIATLLEREIETSARIEVWLNATVCNFELDREAGRLAGVTARSLDGRSMRLQADRFIVAAGTIETTRLLLLLDAASCQRAFQRCQVLGRYFQDHLKAQVATISRRDPEATNRLFGYRFVNGTRRDLHLELAQPAQRRDGVGSAFAYVAMDLAQSPLADVKKLAHGLQRREVDMEAMARTAKKLGLVAKSAWWRFVGHQLFVPANIQLRLMACVEQLPQWTNRIRLSSSMDQLGVPKALFEWVPTSTDELTFRSLVGGISAYWNRAGFERSCPLEWSDAAGDRSRPIIAEAEACAHPSGSTRMGTDARHSVVGPDLHCHAVPNVAVVSASVFPTAGSANPTFTIMKFAMWMADHCLSRRAATHAAPALRIVA